MHDPAIQPGHSRPPSLHAADPASQKTERYEQLCILKFPPSATRHIFDAQISLINAKANPNRNSGDWSRNTSSTSLASSGVQAVAAATLQRTPSITSNRSGASSTGSGISRGRLTPLYDLEFHKFQSTVVIDAGTEAKIAKFLKKGIEIIGFAIIDPLELGATLTKRGSPQQDVTVQVDPPKTEESLSLNANIKAAPASLLNKFKRMSLKSPFKAAAASTVTLAPSSSNPSISDNSSSVLSLFKSKDPTDAINPNKRHAAATEEYELPDGTGPPSKSHAAGYTWMMRKWLRKDLEGQDADVSLMAISLEWKKSKRKRPAFVRSNSSSALSSKRSSRVVSPSSTNHTSSSPPSQLLQLPEQPDEMEALQSTSRTHQSLDLPRRYPAASPPLEDDIEEEEPNLTNPEEDQEDIDSDPEDSERSWSCQLILPPLPNSVSGKPRKIALGVLTPAPHHPRLIAALNIPFSLTSVPLRNQSEAITVEEMKDLLCVTAFWLVVREGLGGIGNRRKGDSTLRL